MLAKLLGKEDTDRKSMNAALSQFQHHVNRKKMRQNYKKGPQDFPPGYIFQSGNTTIACYCDTSFEKGILKHNSECYARAIARRKEKGAMWAWDKRLWIGHADLCGGNSKPSAETMKEVLIERGIR